MLGRVRRRWRRAWMRRVSPGPSGRFAARMAGLGLPPAYGKLPLVQTGYAYLSPQARIAHNQFTFEPRCFVSSGVLVYEEPDSGTVHLEADVHLHEFVTIQTGHEGSVRIGERTHVQPRCQFSAYRGSIDIGARVEIAPNCAFYPYNHGMDASIGMQQQPTYTRGGIVIEDEAWLGFGVIVLDGVKVGRGAVIAAGAVVNTDIPEFAIAAGVPAKVVGSRLDEKWRGSAQA